MFAFISILIVDSDKANLSIWVIIDSIDDY